MCRLDERNYHIQSAAEGKKMKKKKKNQTAQRRKDVREDTRTMERDTAQRHRPGGGEL